MLEVRADLTIGADGRHSVVRERAGLSVLNLGAPMDVLWMRVSRQPTDPGQTFGRFDTGRILVFLNREDYWQVAYVIPKGKADELRQQGLSGVSPGTGPAGAVSARIGWRNCATGMTSSCSRSRSIACADGSGPDCCASEMPRMPCRPSAVSESTWRFRMRWRRRTSWGKGCGWER